LQLPGDDKEKGIHFSFRIESILLHHDKLLPGRPYFFGQVLFIVGPR